MYGQMPRLTSLLPRSSPSRTHHVGRHQLRLCVCLRAGGASSSSRQREVARAGGGGCAGQGGTADASCACGGHRCVGRAWPAMPEPFEASRDLAQAPDMQGGHAVLIASEEQFKVSHRREHLRLLPLRHHWTP